MSDFSLFDQAFEDYEKEEFLNKKKYLSTYRYS